MNTTVKSFISPHISGYLEFRRSLGFKSGQDLFQLRVFDRYLVENGISGFREIDPRFVDELIAASLQAKRPHTVEAHIQILQNFFSFLERRSVISKNPFANARRIRKLYFSPYVFSDAEVERILTSFTVDVSRAKSWTQFVPRIGRYSIIFLIARCGLRISEACQVKVSDVDFKNQTLFIEKTKFYKDRLIPVSAEVLGVLENYLAVRAKIPGHGDSESLFISFYRRSYSRKTTGHYFLLKMKELGLYRESIRRGDVVFGTPCPHSLRHSFAVRTVRRWYASGLQVDKISDTLATYLGHADFDYTRLYLKDLSRAPAPLLIRIEYNERL